MNSRRIRTRLALGAVLGLAAAGNALAAATDTGPSTTTDPYGKNNPASFDLGTDEEVNWDQSSGTAQNSEAAAKGVSLNRSEDGAFDPRHPEDFYFVTTEGGRGATSARDGGGLWRLSYDDVERPWEGGTLTLLLDGSEAPFLSKPDNLGFDRHGHLMIQEDPGGNPHLARIVATT